MGPILVKESGKMTDAKSAQSANTQTSFEEEELAVIDVAVFPKYFNSLKADKSIAVSPEPWKVYLPRKFSDAGSVIVFNEVQYWNI